MNEGLTAAIMVTTDDNDNNIQEQLENIARYLNCFSEYPPNVALVGQNITDPRNLDKVLHGLNAKEWREALQYERNQLEKLGTWKVKDLPQGMTPIPCSKVVKIKCGPKGKIQSY